MTDFRPRTALFGDQLPTNANGTPRAALSQVRWLTLHYTGVNVNYADHGDSPVEIQRIQAYAISAKKPWEYNYVIDTEGVVWEYAGTFQAAHSAGENSESIGVLLLLGIDDNPTPAMVNAVRWLRWVLVQFQTLRGDHEMRPHYQMPGAATACPGARAMGHWDTFCAPWEVVPPPPPPPPPPGDEYKWLEADCRFTLQAGDSPWLVSRLAYGTGTSHAALTAANPGPWSVGRQVVVPGENGVRFKVRQGDYPLRILRDIWPADNAYDRLPTFLRWNGGQRDLQVGETVYAPIEVP